MVWGSSGVLWEAGPTLFRVWRRVRFDLIIHRPCPWDQHLSGCPPSHAESTRNDSVFEPTAKGNVPKRMPKTVGILALATRRIPVETTPESGRSSLVKAKSPWGGSILGMGDALPRGTRISASRHPRVMPRGECALNDHRVCPLGGVGSWDMGHLVDNFLWLTMDERVLGQL